MSPEQKIVQYLNEAHASEQALTRVLQSQIAMTPRGGYRSALETHLAETQDHARRVQRRLGELGQGSNPLQAVVGARRERASARRSPSARRRSTSCAAPAARRRCSRTPRTPPRPRRWRSRPTRRSSAWPRPPATSKTAQLAASIRADEEKMLARMLREVPKLTEAVLDGSFDVATTGAGEAVKRTATATKRAARQARKVPGRRAGRGPGQGRRRVGGATSRSPATTSSPPTRSSAGCRSSRRSTWPRSTPTSAGTRTARRCSTASPRCAATSRGRAMTSSTSTRSAPRWPRPAMTRLEAVRTYERAHKDRTSVLDAAERELATPERAPVVTAGRVRVRTSSMSQIQEHGVDDDLPLTQLRPPERRARSRPSCVPSASASCA